MKTRVREFLIQIHFWSNDRIKDKECFSDNQNSIYINNGIDNRPKQREEELGLKTFLKSSEMSGATCPRCKRPVFHAEEKHAFGKVWHSFCFSCYKCRKLLDCNNISILNGYIFCQNCSGSEDFSALEYPESRRELQEDSQGCPVCKYSSAPCSVRSDSTRSLNSHATPHGTPLCLRATPIPTAITTWYNRQHPSKHSHLGDAKVCSYVKEYCEKIENEKCSPIDRDNEDGRSTKTDSSKFPCDGGILKKLRNETKCKHMKVNIFSREVDTTIMCSCGGECIKKAEVSDYSSRPSTAGTQDSGGESERNDDKMTSFGGGGIECRRCGKNVYHAEMMLASGAAFHTICFSCNSCRKPLDMMTVNESQNEIYCKQCYSKLFGPSGYGYGLGAGVLQTM